MSRIRSAFATGAILVGSSVALLTGGIAKAEPAPAVPAPAPGIPGIPGAPGMDMITQLAGNAPQLLQAASQMFNPKPATAPVTPPVAGLAPLAPLAAPIAPLAPLAQPLTGAPAIQPPILGNSGDLPASAAPGALGLPNLPAIPGLPAPVSQALNFPGELSKLMPGAPGGGGLAQPASVSVPQPAATSPMPGLGTLFPTSALP